MSSVVTSNAVPADRVLLGHITGIYGLKGWVKVHSDTNPRDNIVTYKSWWMEQGGNWKEVRVLQGRPQGKTIVAQLEGFETPEEAGTLIGASIAISRIAMPEPAKGEYYWADLIGMHVRTVEGVDVGAVVRLFETGANDVVVVSDEREEVEGPREVLVPWLVPDVITDVNVKDRVVTIDWDPDF
ncbi:ribosome maturation factor RimM [Granulosicoccus antarcticus]|uniref:Ribosome maturation factor RimM n=1 Tax=Granulosicoccus antarcticus IMCC3135 TaxID=1192854 RepID=A0A2Z2NZW7_9GAMM|nr:ribosome maturation factor RimM [Granulosicoccus antarcticus]ASJ75995.1 Ribosome maturation factor RimM [Granulosicoccus antarcticus IMCC3135]